MLLKQLSTFSFISLMGRQISYILQPWSSIMVQLIYVIFIENVADNSFSKIGNLLFKGNEKFK
jgi:hypothetical protein